MRLTLLLLLLSVFAQAQGQLNGRVTDSQGQPLPFASVYIQNTSTGTTTNVEGYYKLPLGPGPHQVAFQYVGYQTRVETVDMREKVQTLDIALEEEAVILSAVVVRPTDEDPAYGIIRKAIEKRRYYLERVKAFSCEVYIKGGLKMLDAPKKFMGQDIGDMGGLLDSSSRQGILYLSESESRWHVQRPNQSKEIMVSSKVSGNNQGFSFNSAADVNFDFYENTTDYSRPIVSPIAYNALSFYTYALEGTVFDEAGRMIYKIRLAPKQPELPAYGGYIYIADELFNIQGADVFVTGASLNQPALDTLFIKQTHVQVQKPDVWRIFNQVLTIRGNFFGFKFGGDFTSIYRNYDLNPVFPKNFFGPEYFRVEDGANEKGLAHFDTIRPLPLTQEESLDYIRRDSLQVIRESKPFMDSLDRKNNKFQTMSLLTGYTYQRSYERESFSIESPVASILFHTVQGWYGYMGLRYRKAFDRERTRRLSTGLRVQYGISENRPRAAADFQYDFNSTRFSRLKISGGLDVEQFNPENPISPMLNSIYTLWGRRNYSKIYEKWFAKAEGRHEIANGLMFRGSLEYALRNPLVNNSDYSFNRRSTRPYTANDPQNPDNFDPAFDSHDAVLLDVSLRYVPGQRYISYPKNKFITGSKWPAFGVRYRAGLAPGDARFHYLSASIDKDNIEMGVWGRSAFLLQAGFFPSSAAAYFMDYRHFNGNQTIFGNPSNYNRTFFLLTYYDFSTLRPHAQAHYQHEFRGYLFDKIPGIRKLGLAEAVSAKALLIEGQDIYWEAAFGIDQIGIGIARFLRVDVAAAFHGAKFDRWGVVVGLNIPIDLN
jgi:hypothetical protein